MIFKIKNNKLAAVLVAILVLTVFLFSASNVFLSSTDFIVDKIKENTGVSIGKSLYDFESAINLFRPKKDLWGGEITIIQLKFSEGDIKHF